MEMSSTYYLDRIEQKVELKIALSQLYEIEAKKQPIKENISFKIMEVAACLFILITTIYVIKNDKGKDSFQQKIKTEVSHSAEATYISFDNVWCGSFQLVWNELKEYCRRDIQFKNDNPSIINNLNTSSFSKKDISEKDYYIKLIDVSKDKNAKDEIKKDLENKFDVDNSQLINSIDLSSSNGIVLYSMINKVFEYVHPFDDVGTMSFFDKKTNEASSVKYFGTDKSSKENVYENTTLLFYENFYDLVLKLDTKNEEEIYLYKNYFDDSCSLDELYSEMNKKIEEYDGNIKIKKGDIIKIPEISIDYTINYDELCGKEIVGLNGKYISNAIQTINMALDSNGGQVKSEAAVITDSMASYPMDGGGYYIFDSSFVIFIKEKGKDNPYFMAKIVDPTFLIKE